MVRSKAEKRILRWTADLGRWAVRTGKANPNTEIDWYCAGVYAASQYKLGKVPLPSGYDPESTSTWSNGFRDALTLLSHAEDLGDAPQGDYASLLKAAAS
jgi:hypothetical protein